MGEIYLVFIEGDWEEMTLDDMLTDTLNGSDYLLQTERRLYTGVDDINGNKIFDQDEVLEQGHYVNSDKTSTYTVTFKPNHGAWLRGDTQRLTPINVKKYKIKVINR